MILFYDSGFGAKPAPPENNKPANNKSNSLYRGKS